MGTGEGTWLLRRARAEPARFFIGIDSNGENLAPASRRASCKPQRGGASNVLYVQAAAESLPPELEGLASALTVLLPWGSLLAAIAMPQMPVLVGLARLCRPAAQLRVIFGYHASLEPAVIALPPLTTEHLTTLPARYAEAGFSVSVRALSNRELVDLRTSWSSRLAYGRARQLFELRGRYVAQRAPPEVGSAWGLGLRRLERISAANFRGISRHAHCCWCARCQLRRCSRVASFGILFFSCQARFMLRVIAQRLSSGL